MIVGYRLINSATNELAATWGGRWGQCPGIPTRVSLPNGDQVHNPSIGADYGGFTLIEWEMEYPAPTVPEMITRPQCALQLLNLGMVTSVEAIEMARTGTPPSSVQLAFDQMPEPDKTVALINFAANSYYRNNRLIPSLMEANGMDGFGVDLFFIAASRL